MTVLLAFLIDASNGNLLFGTVVPEPLALLVFGVGLVGATVGLRKILRRHDAEKANVIVKSEKAAKGIE